MKTRIIGLVLVIAGLTTYGLCIGNPKPKWNLHRIRRDAFKPINSTSQQINNLWKSTAIDELKQDLLFRYDKYVRPAQHTNKTTITIDPTIIHVDLDEENSIIMVHCWIKMTWEDEKLKWNPNKYNSLTFVNLADHEIWQPDIFPYNSATGSMIDHYGNTNLIIHSNGSVEWMPPSLFRVFCHLYLDKWPFDTQTCYVRLGSWTYTGDQLDVESAYFANAVLPMDNIQPNPEWDLVRVTFGKHPPTEESYANLVLEITMKRHSTTYRGLLITPVSAIILMTFAVFWLPPTSGDKLTLAGVSVVTTSIFVLYFSVKLPVLSGNTPHIVYFYTRALLMTSLSVVIAIIVINLARNPKLSPLPWVLKKALDGWLSTCLLIENPRKRESPKSEEMIDSQPVLSEQERHLSEASCNTYQGDWILLATAIDRIFFLIYCLIFVIMALAYSV